MNTTSARVVELIPGTLYRIYGVLPLDGSVSWAAPADGGVEAVSLYALRSEEGVLLIDSGVPAHREEILEALTSVIGDATVSIIVTRIEPDTLGNLYAILASFPVKEVVAVAPAPNPFDFVNAFPMHTPLPADAPGRLRRLPPGGTHTICGFELELIRAPLRVLATAWLYLESEGVLFTSDTFGFTKLRDDHDAVLDSPTGDEDVAELERHLSAKFGWLAESDAQAVLDQTREVFDARSVRMVAPTHGKVLAGENVVTAYLSAVSSLFAEPTMTGGE